MLKREKIPHTVLNAKYHQQEAEIVQRAGQRGHRHHRHQHGRPRHRHQTRRRACRTRAACTSSAPSATKRAASTASCAAVARARAIRARSHFYVSFEDDLMRLFGAADRMTKIMEHIGLEEGQELEHPLAEPLDRDGAEARRAAQLSRPQTHARLRRRDEQAARGRLRLSQRDHRHRGAAQADLRSDRRSGPGEGDANISAPAHRARNRTTPACCIG